MYAIIILLLILFSNRGVFFVFLFFLLVPVTFDATSVADQIQVHFCLHKS